MNYFAQPGAAARYAEFRPYYHPHVIAKIKKQLGITNKLNTALDIACGTGQSALALLELAQTVIATDISAGMLTVAKRTSCLHYAQAAAEAMPFGDGRFELITAAMSYHWFDRQRFLAEAARLLRPGGWLVLYNNWFAGKMKKNPRFKMWNSSQYMARYPTPPHHGEPHRPADAAPPELTLAQEETFSNEVWFSVEQLAGYLTTQSNVIAKIESDDETLAGALQWLTAGLSPLFSTPRENFVFGGGIWYLRKA